MKYTVAKLKALVKKRDAAIAAASNLTAKLLKNCTHPKSMMRTKIVYNTDDSGHYGTTTCHDFCSLCHAYIGTYYGCDESKEERPHYPLLSS